MNNTRPFLCVAAIVFAIVALAHIVRALTGTDIAIGSWHVPLALSWVGALVTGGLSAWAGRLATRA